MPTCWTCNAGVPAFRFHCDFCGGMLEWHEIRRSWNAEQGADLSQRLAALFRIEREGFEALRGQFAELSNVLEWGFDDLRWDLYQQTGVLKGLDGPQQTPAQVQAGELRRSADELRRHGNLAAAEGFYRKALEQDARDYRSHVGLSLTYLQLNRSEDAKTALKDSLACAPRGEIDYRSYSLRLIGHLDACEGAYPKAAGRLASAVQFSPEYAEALYDYARYCARVGEERECCAAIRKAIDLKPLYYHLAEQEPSFDKVRFEVTRILEGILVAARGEAQQALDEARRAVQQTAEEVAEEDQDEDAEELPSDVAKRIEKRLEDAEAILKQAEERMASGDYPSTLTVAPLVEDAVGLARDAQLEIWDHRRASQQTLLQRHMDALWTIPVSMMLTMLTAFTGWLVAGLAGYGWKMVQFEFGEMTRGFLNFAPVGGVLGILAGVVWGVYRYLAGIH